MVGDLLQDLIGHFEGFLVLAGLIELLMGGDGMS